MWAAQNILGGCCEHSCILDQQGTINSFRVQDSREGVDRKRTQVLTLEDFLLQAYVHVDPEKRDKLDAKVVKCYFIGYGSNLFGYRFWDDKNRKILRHCDVKFNKSVLYKDREKKVLDITKQVEVHSRSVITKY